MNPILSRVRTEEGAGVRADREDLLLAGHAAFLDQGVPEAEVGAGAALQFRPGDGVFTAAAEGVHRAGVGAPALGGEFGAVGAVIISLM